MLTIADYDFSLYYLFGYDQLSPDRRKGIVAIALFNSILADLALEQLNFCVLNVL